MMFNEVDCESLVRQDKCHECPMGYCERWDAPDEGVSAADQQWEDDYEYYLQSLEDER